MISEVLGPIDADIEINATISSDSVLGYRLVGIAFLETITSIASRLSDYWVIEKGGQSTDIILTIQLEKGIRGGQGGEILNTRLGAGLNKQQESPELVAVVPVCETLSQLRAFPF